MLERIAGDVVDLKSRSEILLGVFMNVPDVSRLSYPRLCGLIGGNPSRLSQSMHNAGFRHLNIPFVYSAFQIEQVDEAIRSMRALGIRGFSVTIPHKETVLRLLDRLSPDAEAIGAVNTIVNDGQILTGHNTDWTGLLSAFAEQQVDLSGKNVLVLGAGGASLAVSFAMLRAGARRVSLWNRTRGRGEAVAQRFGLDIVDSGRIPSDVFQDFQVICNTTSLGSKQGTSENVLSHTSDYPFELSQLQPQQIVFDAVTNETLLTKFAVKRGCKLVTGPRMLLFQALEQFTLFTGEEAPREVMEKALLDQLE